MAAKLNIIELDRELRIDAERILSLRTALLSSALVGGLGAWTGLKFLGNLASVAIAFWAALSMFLGMTQKSRASLRAAPHLFVSSGRILNGIDSKRRVITDHILHLDYREDTAGPDNDGSPQGLYAVVNGGVICLLPDLDEHQTYMVIGRIEDKFPELQRLWARASRSGESLTTLRLNDPTPIEFTKGGSDA